MQTTGIRATFSRGLQSVLLLLALVLLAPHAHAHEDPHGEKNWDAAHHTFVPVISILTDPCGDDGGPCRCADGQPCVSPDLTKLPALALQSFSFPSSVSKHDLAAPVPEHPRPRILAGPGAPRAPPLPQ